MELRKPDNELLLAALRWHEDETLNEMTGAGKGFAGKILAQTVIKEQIANPTDNTILLAVWDEDKPVGYISYSDIKTVRKMCDVHITIDPELHGSGLGTQALALALDKAFTSDLYRVQFQPFKNNKQAIGLAKKLGFTLEAFMKSSGWVDEAPRDQALFRMLRNEWERKKKRLGE